MVHMFYFASGLVLGFTEKRDFYNQLWEILVEETLCVIFSSFPLTQCCLYV